MSLKMDLAVSDCQSAERILLFDWLLMILARLKMETEITGITII